MKNNIRQVYLLTALLLLTSTAILAQKTTAEYFKLGVEQAGKQDYDGAIKSFTECLKASNPYIECRANRGLMYYKKKNYEASAADYTEVIKRDSNDENAYIRRGLAYYELGKTNLAVADYRAALKINPNNAGVKKLVAEISELEAIKRKFAEDRQEYADMQPAMTELAAPFLAEANQLLGKKDFNGAIAVYTRCLETYKAAAVCLKGRGVAYSGLKNFDAALKDLNELVNFMPTDESYSTRASIHGNKKDYKAAIADFTEAIKLKNSNANYYLYRGLAYYFSNEKKLAAADYKKALEINPALEMAKEGLQRLGEQP